MWSQRTRSRVDSSMLCTAGMSGVAVHHHAMPYPVSLSPLRVCLCVCVRVLVYACAVANVQPALGTMARAMPGFCPCRRDSADLLRHACHDDNDYTCSADLSYGCHCVCDWPRPCSVGIGTCWRTGYTHQWCSSCGGGSRKACCMLRAFKVGLACNGLITLN